MAKRYAISITNWEEHQERPDRANYVWFKLYQRMLTGGFWTSSTLEQKAMWVTLMCLRNSQQQEVLLVPDFVLAGHCGDGVKITDVEKILIGLNGLGVIQDESRQFPGQTQEFAWPRLEKNREEKRREEEKGPGECQRLQLAPQLVGEYSLKAKSLLETVKLETQDSWLKAYPDPAWIKQEINKAAAWVTSNPKKTSKNFSRFMSNWLAKGWENFRKTIPSNKPEGDVPEWKRKAMEEERLKNGA